MNVSQPSERRTPWHILTPCLLFACCTVAAAQSGSLPPRPDTIRADKSSPTEDGSPIASLEEEMRVKRMIKYAEKEHRDNLARASEVVHLGKELATSFEQKKQLDREDSKRLDRLEKLTRKLRSEAGGEDGDTTLEEPPRDLNSGVTRIEEVTVSVGEKVKQTPRKVVSAAVIDEANVLLELIRLVRNMARFPSR